MSRMHDDGVWMYREFALTSLIDTGLYQAARGEPNAHQDADGRNPIWTAGVPRIVAG